MLRALIVLMLTLTFFSCATTVTSSRSVDSGYLPEKSHFWCGDNCVVAGGCEEGLICGCIMYYNGRDDLMTKATAEEKLWDYAVLEVRKQDKKDYSVYDLQRQPYEIREIRTDFGSKKVCGAFPRYEQLGSRF